MTLIELPGHDIIGIRANNPGWFTLSGTNSWIVSRDPAWLVDPGPALDEHLDVLSREIDSRGGLGGIALTHDHSDHAEAVPAMRERFAPVPWAAARGEADTRLGDGSSFGPLKALSTPGHAPDHLAYVVGSVVLTGDAVLGEGSVFIAPDPARWPATWPDSRSFAGSSRSSWPPVTGRWSAIRGPSSIST